MATRNTGSATAPAAAGDSAVRAAAPMPWLSRQLSAVLQQPGHALLLEGPSGLGQFELALEMARALLCEARAPQAPACGQCASCHAVDVRTHADLLVLLPETLQLQWGWDSGESESAGDGRRKPSREIRIEAIRRMITFCQRTDARGRGKVVLIYPAENMNVVSANALLKTLEEPPGASRFILASQAPQRLLPTIRSRCHSWHMQWPQPDQVSAWLLAGGAAPQQAEAALAAAGGRPLEAWQLLEDNFDAQAWQRLPAQLARGQAGGFMHLSPGAAITVLQQICHDAMALLVGAKPRYFTLAAMQAIAAAQGGPSWDSLADPIRQGALGQLGQWSAELMAAARTSEHPFNVEVMLTALVERGRAALHFMV